MRLTMAMRSRGQLWDGGSGGYPRPKKSCAREDHCGQTHRAGGRAHDGADGVRRLVLVTCPLCVCAPCVIPLA